MSDDALTTNRELEQLEAETVKPPEDLRGGGQMGRFGAAGMPLERSKDFKNSTRRLAARLAPEGLGVAAVLILAIASVTLLVIAPKILGNATNIIVDGVTSGKGINFTKLHSTLLLVLCIYAASAALALSQGRLLAGVVQRAMFKLRSDVEDKLNRMPLRYVDRQPRGDMLSRVTNDIDNLAQSLQQTLSQLLTSTLTLVGVLIMMLTISSVLALVALVTIPMSILTMRAITKRSKIEVRRPVASHGHAERAGRRGVHRPLARQGVRPPEGRREEVQRQERGALPVQLRRTVHLRDDPARDDVLRQPELRRNRTDRRAHGLVGPLTIGGIQAFIQYSRQFTQPLTQLASMINVMQSGIASAERVFELLDAPEEIEDDLVPLEDLEPAGPGRVRPRIVLLRPGEPAHRGPLTRRASQARRSPSSVPPVRARPRS